MKRNLERFNSVIGRSWTLTEQYELFKDAQAMDTRTESVRRERLAQYADRPLNEWPFPEPPSFLT